MDLTALDAALRGAALTLSVKRAACGRAQPQIVVACPASVPEHRARGVVFAVAALASLAVPLDASWIVRGDPGARRVYVDLAEGAHGREIARALHVLRGVVT